MRPIVVILSTLTLTSACITPGFGTTLRVLCGFADVLISETDLGEIQDAFAGEDNAAKLVCDAILKKGVVEPGAPQPIVVTGETIIPLPSNVEQTKVTVLPPTS
ncbi:hypothetical protein [Ruegeria sp. HKCCD6604]|uniref:hypothetical protein n=1 Tax=Ruegeria sp. HKCCD6604 TaxID=2683000 RepID=UPI001491A3CC|nr:hypothetical protein [Ruegeria sp. HKCCD6604]NOC90617.1 hypothetical protein [Ruegeria sp. HKCCD6604]